MAILKPQRRWYFPSSAIQGFLRNCFLKPQRSCSLPGRAGGTFLVRQLSCRGKSWFWVVSRGVVVGGGGRFSTVLLLSFTQF